MTLTIEEQQIVDDFHRLYYDKLRLFQRLKFLGTYTVKYPTDLMVYAEILYDCRPELLIECGTHAGGSAMFLAWVMDAITAVQKDYRGRILSVDIYDLSPPSHPRVHYIHGSSTDQRTFEAISDHVAKAGSVMAILDSDHSEDHVFRELEIYSPLVTEGQYLIVEDTNVNGHPVYEDHGPGPMEAVQRFLAQSNLFDVDHSRETFLLTSNPGGFLRRSA